MGCRFSKKKKKELQPPLFYKLSNESFCKYFSQDILCDIVSLNNKVVSNNNVVGFNIVINAKLWGDFYKNMNLYICEYLITYILLL
jgi:hypothetical protein